MRNSKASGYCLDQGAEDDDRAILYPCHGMSSQVGVRQAVSGHWGRCGDTQGDPLPGQTKSRASGAKQALGSSRHIACLSPHPSDGAVLVLVRPVVWMEPEVFLGRRVTAASY